MLIFRFYIIESIRDSLHICFDFKKFLAFRIINLIEYRVSKRHFEIQKFYIVKISIKILDFDHN